MPVKQFTIYDRKLLRPLTNLSLPRCRANRLGISSLLSTAMPAQPGPLQRHLAIHHQLSHLHHHRSATLHGTKAVKGRHFLPQMIIAENCPGTISSRWTKFFMTDLHSTVTGSLLLRLNCLHDIIICINRVTASAKPKCIGHECSVMTMFGHRCHRSATHA